MPISYNIAPSQKVLTIRFNPKSQQRSLDAVQWGLIPYWAKDPKIAYRTINARAESVDKAPSFRQAFAKRRCLIPADGFADQLQHRAEPEGSDHSLQSGNSGTLARRPTVRINPLLCRRPPRSLTEPSTPEPRRWIGAFVSGSFRKATLPHSLRRILRMAKNRQTQAAVRDRYG